MDEGRFSRLVLCRNELGSILAIIFPIVVLYSIQNKELETRFILIPSLLMIYSLIQVGTKVGMGSIGATLAAAIGIIVLQLFDRKIRTKIPCV